MARRDGARHAPPGGRRASVAVLALLAALALLLVARFTVGLAPHLFYGLAGGIAMSLLIVARDRLHGITRRAEGRERGAPIDPERDGDGG